MPFHLPLKGEVGELRSGEPGGGGNSPHPARFARDLPPPGEGGSHADPAPAYQNAGLPVATSCGQTVTNFTWPPSLMSWPSGVISPICAPFASSSKLPSSVLSWPDKLKIALRKASWSRLSVTDSAFSSTSPVV